MDISREIQRTKVSDHSDVKTDENLPLSALISSSETTNRLAVPHLPRQSIKPASSSSDSEDSGESDDGALSWKRSKVSRKKSPAANMIENSWPASEEFRLHAATLTADGKLGVKPKASKFNVWSNVLAEQGLVEDLHSVGVEQERCKNDRGVEGYNFALKNKHQGGDDRPLWLQDSKEIHRRLGCKRSVKERLGELSTIRRDKRTFTISENDSDDVVVTGIATILREPKQELIDRAVKTIGKKKCLEILEMTEDIEENGGMMTADGSRPRTPGGIFLLLIRNDYDITREEVDAIFGEDRRLQARAKRDIVKAKRKQSAMKLQSNSPELPELPTIAELLLKQHALGRKMDTKVDKERMELNAEDDVSEKEAGEIDSD